MMNNTRTLVLGALSALCLLVAPACDKNAAEKKDEKKTEVKADAKADDAKADDAKADDAKADDAKADDAKADDAKADGGAAAAVPESIGVPECDDYIAKMSKCIEGMDATSAAAAKIGFETVVKGWKDSVETNPDGKAGIATSCTAAMDGAAMTHPDCFKAE